ncbi:MAG: hypothetical protein WCY02_06630 [Parvibaculum sp.]
MSRATIIIAILLLVAIAGGIFYFSRAVEPQPQSVEKVLSDDQFAR